MNKNDYAIVCIKQILMKLIFSLNVLAGLFLITGCSKSFHAVSIVGNYSQATYSITNCSDTANNYNETCLSSCSVIVTSTTFIQEGITSLYLLNGDIIKLNPNSNNPVSYTFVLSSTALILTKTNTTTGCIATYI